MPQKKRYRGSYNEYGVWVSAAEKQEDDENKRLYPKSSYGSYRKQRTNRGKKIKRK